MLLRVGRHFRGSAVSPAICERWCSRSQNAYLEDLVVAAFVKAAERWCWLIALVFLRETFVGVCARHTYPSVYHCQRRGHHFWPHLLSQRVLPSLANLEGKKWQNEIAESVRCPTKISVGETRNRLTNHISAFEFWHHVPWKCGSHAVLSVRQL